MRRIVHDASLLPGPFFLLVLFLLPPRFCFFFSSLGNHHFSHSIFIFVYSYFFSHQVNFIPRIITSFVWSSIPRSSPFP